MLLGTVLTVLLVWFRPAAVPRWAIWLSVGLQMCIWVSTAAIQVPIQIQLSSDGLSLPLIQKLIFTNLWLRKVPQVINMFLFLWMMSLLLQADDNVRISLAQGQDTYDDAADLARGYVCRFGRRGDCLCIGNVEVCQAVR